MPCLEPVSVLTLCVISTQEFAFTSELPQKKTRVGLLGQIRDFWQETDGGAIPVSLARKILKCSDVTIYRYIENKKLHGYKFNKTVLVSIKDVEKLLDEPKNKGGRPVKENT